MSLYFSGNFLVEVAVPRVELPGPNAATVILYEWPPLAGLAIACGERGADARPDFLDQEEAICWAVSASGWMVGAFPAELRPGSYVFRFLSIASST